MFINRSLPKTVLMINKCFIIVVIFFISTISYSQKVVDQVIAVIGNDIILQSDIENQYQQFLSQGYKDESKTKCSLLEELVYEKLLLVQSKVDSIKVTEAQVESELDKRLRYFINQVGSEKKLEEYFNKSILEIKDEFKEKIHDQLLTQNMQQKITKDIKVTPKETRDYFEQLPKDSLPYINSELEIAEIDKLPQISQSERTAIIDKLQGLRKRIENGENFATLAVLYSDDPGSAAKGGELGFVNRGQLVPEFEAAAFSLEKGQLSDIIETEYGFHILQVIEHRGDMVNVRHILLKPKVSAQDLQRAYAQLDSIRGLIETNKISFTEAAEKFSDDAKTKNNGGTMINPNTGTTHFEASQIDPSIFFIVDKMKVGEISRPVSVSTPDSKQGYRIVFLKSKSDPHTANLRDDYQKIQEALLAKKQSAVINEWVNKRKSTTYIRIDNDYLSCKFKHKWIN